MLAIASKGNPNDWEKFVRPVCFPYNTSIQASIGYTLYYLMYGCEDQLQIDLQFAISFSDTLSSDLYVQQLQLSLSYAYQIVTNTLGIIQQ